MSEILHAAQNEDSLPKRPWAPALGMTEYGTLDFDHDQPHTLGELVVTDERDPFHWLATHVQVLAPMTEDGKHVLWGLYRANGNMPAGPEGVKWRDEVLAREETTLRPSLNDWKYIHLYHKHLYELDERNRELRTARHAGEPGAQPHEPDMNVIALIINSYATHLRAEASMQNADN